MWLSGTLDVNPQSVVNKRWRNKRLKHLCSLWLSKPERSYPRWYNSITRGFESWWYSNFELGLLIGSLLLGHRTTNSREEADWNLMGVHWRQFPRCMLTHAKDCPVANKQGTVCVCVCFVLKSRASPDNRCLLDLVLLDYMHYTSTLPWKPVRESNCGQ